MYKHDSFIPIFTIKTDVWVANYFDAENLFLSLSSAIAPSKSELKIYVPKMLNTCLAVK